MGAAKTQTTCEFVFQRYDCSDTAVAGFGPSFAIAFAVSGRHRANTGAAA